MQRIRQFGVRAERFAYEDGVMALMALFTAGIMITLLKTFIES